MEQRVRIRLQTNSFIKGIHHQWVIVMITDPKSHDPAVVKIQNGTQIQFLDNRTDIVFELRYISQPLLIRFISMKIPFQYILCSNHRC